MISRIEYNSIFVYLVSIFIITFFQVFTGTIYCYIYVNIYTFLLLYNDGLYMLLSLSLDLEKLRKLFL